MDYNRWWNINLVYKNKFHTFVRTKQNAMKGKFKIGTITRDEILTVYKKASREMELENATGWVSKHKVHKSSKDYKRNPKHKNLAF